MDIMRNPGKGYRLLTYGEAFAPGDQWFSGGRWRTLSLHMVGDMCDGLTGYARRRDPTQPIPAPKKPKKPKASKLHTWDPYELGIGPKDTKNLMLIRALTFMYAANQLGTENAKLKNTIATLRKKAAK